MTAAIGHLVQIHKTGNLTVNNAPPILVLHFLIPLVSLTLWIAYTTGSSSAMPISPQALAFWRAMAAAPAQVSLPIEERRASGEHAEDATAEPVGVTTKPWRNGLVVRPSTGAVTATVLYVFGGGYMLGSPQSRRKTAGHLALAAHAEVYVPGYRLAPEHPFPAAFNDVLERFGRCPAGVGSLLPATPPEVGWPSSSALRCKLPGWWSSRRGRISPAAAAA